MHLVVVHLFGVHLVVVCRSGVRCSSVCRSGVHRFGTPRSGIRRSGVRRSMYAVLVYVEKEELTKALEEKIPVLAREYGGKLNAILRGSDAAFKQAKDRFLDQLEDHLTAFMTKLYAPEQITRRNKEIEYYLSQNIADPDRRKELDDMMRFMASAVHKRILK